MINVPSTLDMQPSNAFTLRKCIYLHGKCICRLMSELQSPDFLAAIGDNFHPL